MKKKHRAKIEKIAEQIDELHSGLTVIAEECGDELEPVMEAIETLSERISYITEAQQ